jgi:hypothetical protein
MVVPFYPYHIASVIGYEWSRRSPQEKRIPSQLSGRESSVVPKEAKSVKKERNKETKKEIKKRNKEEKKKSR